ncbi:sulfite oxidase [Streptomyces orinoci]|uniref:Sulfite oxidase n=1 Tax=Streptomyces orinoci TaxID=67339 RepID=A0ABV3K446_STRON|nr:sulfite oxidase [Streptomyces orinoci]
MGNWHKRDDMLVHQTEPYNAEPPPGALTGHLTPVDTFYSRNHGPIPRIAATGWRLRVDGLVEHPLELSLDELRNRFAEHRVTATLQCAGNRRGELMAYRDIPGQVPWGPAAVSTARWSGVRLADVLAAAGLRTEAAHIAFTGGDLTSRTDPPQPFGGSVPVAKALSAEVLLAWGMNDRPLPAAHGAPLRVVVPGWIGARSVKWLRRVTARAEVSDNHFHGEYSILPPEADPRAAGPDAGLILGPLALHCAILRPGRDDQLPSGPTEITGYALAGDDRAVTRVDVSADRGRTWTQAELDPPLSPWAWQHWRSTLTLPPGRVELLARAWDSTGAVQPESPATVWNPRGYGNNSWARVRVSCRP